MTRRKKITLSGEDMVTFVNDNGCFDLQFRRDVKHNRTNKPVYYSWKTQFAIVARKDDQELLSKIENTLGCGAIHFIKGDKSKADQIRYSVQDIESLYNIIAPFFRENPLSGKKQKDFELWAKAVEILCQNRGKYLKKWRKKDFRDLVDIHKSMQQYKAKRSQRPKWVSIAQELAKTL